MFEDGWVVTRAAKEASWRRSPFQRALFGGHPSARAEARFRHADAWKTQSIHVRFPTPWSVGKRWYTSDVQASDVLRASASGRTHERRALRRFLVGRISTAMLNCFALPKNCAASPYLPWKASTSSPRNARGGNDAEAQNMAGGQRQQPGAPQNFCLSGRSWPKSPPSRSASAQT